LPRFQRSAGRKHHFQRSRCPSPISWIEPLGRLGIECLEPAAIVLHWCVTDLGSDFRIDVGHRRDPVEESAKIKASAPRQDRKPSLRMQCGDLNLRQFRPGRRRTRLRRIAESVKAMIGAITIPLARGRTQHRKVAIDLGAVGVDDGAAGAFGEGQCKCRLAARRRSGN